MTEETQGAHRRHVVAISNKVSRDTMVVLTPLWEANPVEYLVQWKFPEAILFGALKARGRGSHTDEQWQEIQDKAEAYRLELRALPEPEFDLLVEEARKTEKERYNAFREEQERNQLFNRPNAEADFVQWASASYWTLDEATALSLGKDPRIVTWSIVSSQRHVSPFAKAFEARRDLMQRAATMGQLGQQTSPFVVLAWAERMRVSVPAPLVEAVRAIGFQIADWKTAHDGLASVVEQLRAELQGKHDEHLATIAGHTEYLEKLRARHAELSQMQDDLVAKKDELIGRLKQINEALVLRVGDLEAAQASDPGEKPLMTRERDSLLKLVIGMAVKGYSFNPMAGRSSVTKEIAGDLTQLGIALDEDTVRKYLAEAKQLLPGDEPELQTRKR